MLVGRIVGLFCLALALMAGGAELVRSLEAGAWDPLALGQLWYRLHPSSLNVTQAVVQRYLHPAIWDPAAIFVLRWPAWLFFGLVGAAVLALVRWRRRRRRWFGRR